MNVFRGSPWQNGHGQVGFGLGGLFRSVARAVMPIVKSGANLDANMKVGPINNFMHSLHSFFSLFTQATGTYAYCSYLQTLLNYGPSAKQSQLTSSLFYKDTAGKMDIADPHSS